MLVASYLYILCQALDLRALQAQLTISIDEITREELAHHFGRSLPAPELRTLLKHVRSAVHAAMESSSTMDAVPRMQAAAAATTTPIVDFLTSRADVASNALGAIADFRTAVAARATARFQQLQVDFLSGAQGAAPASAYLGRTRLMYEYVRVTLGIKMHGSENLSRFESGLGVDEQTIGQNISLIYEAIRDGQMQGVVVSLFEQ